MSTGSALRGLGYSVTGDGRIDCRREDRNDNSCSPGFERYSHEWTGTIRIELQKDTKRGREVVDLLLAVIDEPRALIGRSRDGSAVVLGRTAREIIPAVSGHDTSGRFDLMTQDGVQFVIVCRSQGETLDVGAYSWPKGRSPLDVARDSLAMLRSDTAKAVIDEAFKFASTPPTEEEIEAARARESRLQRIRDEIAAGLHTDEAIAIRADEELAASMPPETSYKDGTLVFDVMEARARLARRKREAEMAK